MINNLRVTTDGSRLSRLERKHRAGRLTGSALIVRWAFLGLLKNEVPPSSPQLLLDLFGLVRWRRQFDGYRKIRDENGPTLIQDPDRAPFIRKAFEMYATGCFTKKDVLREITKQGLRTKNGKRLASQTFEELLEKEIYAGILSVKTWDLRVNGTFEPIVSEAIFEKV